MPSKRQYDLVQNDDYDTRIPLHPEEAFHHGITFQAKYIGMLDVPRPTSRVEIVAAMRRIRYEFKAKGIKKKKVTIEVSVDGVRVTLRKKKKRKHWMEDGKSVLLNHPIYRIFYVSHDSQDLKIFSYIARDGASNVFKCAVFKSSKKSQAMRVVRTIGQAFEVCHKLSITAPENVDDDDQDTFTQDLLSDRLSDITSDKPKKDLSESASDKGSLPTDDCSLKDLENNRNSRIPPQLDLIPPPPSTNNRKSPLMAGETYSSPHSDALLSAAMNGGGVGGGGGGGMGSCSNLPPAGTALSAHHELQLMREQLEQQTQQTQAAMAQLQLAREQLQAEQSARLEAQARTHQLLVHNRELLDHIAALVAHLQGGDKPGQQQSPPHMTMPQHHQMAMSDGYDTSDPSSVESSPVLPPFNYMSQGLIENRAAVASCLQPSSPLRTTFNPAAFPFGYASGESAAFEAQLLQRLQALASYPPYHQGYYAPPSFVPPIYGQQTLLNNNYTLQPPPQKKMAPPSPMLSRNSYAGTTSLQGSRLSPARNSEPRQLPNQYQNINLRVNEHQTQNSTYQNQQSQNSAYQHQHYQTQNDQQTQKQQYQQSSNQNQQQQHLRVQDTRQQRETTPVPQSSSERKQTQFIKPQAQMGTLTTTDSNGRMRVIVPVPSNSNEGATEMMRSLKIEDDDLHASSAPVTRSKSEKVPNRSQLMAEVHRTTWARHTTK